MLLKFCLATIGVGVFRCADSGWRTFCFFRRKTWKKKNAITAGKNTVYLERGIPYFAFVDTNAVLVRQIDEA